MNSIQQRWFKSVEQVAEKSLCIRTESQMGAIAVKNNMVIAEGYNGAIKKFQPCSVRGFCIRKKQGVDSGTRREVGYCICAEQRMICNAARSSISLEDADVYLIYMPCAVCVRLMSEVGVKRIFYKIKRFDNPLAEELAEEAGLEMVKL